MTIFLILCSFIVCGLCIAALIVNSDLQKAIDYTSCNTQNIIAESYDGNTNVTAPWSGIKNFDDDINLFGINIQNTIPILTDYFSATNPAYQQVIDTAAASLYAKSQVYDCQNSSQVIQCPFPSSIQNCSDPYDPLFDINYCDPAVSTSAKALISG